MDVMPEKGSLWVARNGVRRENGVDVECVYEVTSVRNGFIFTRPTWKTPTKSASRPYPWPIERQMGWVLMHVRHASFEDTFRKAE